MKTIPYALFILALSAAIPAVHADTYVDPYVRSDGTYVQGHHRSEANGNPYDNYSHRGNINPHTGEHGHHSDTYQQPSHSYGSGGGTYGNGYNYGYRHNADR